MKTSTATKTSDRPSFPFGAAVDIPAVLVAHAPAGAANIDRLAVMASLTVGRSPECELPLRDDKVSKRHLRIFPTQQGIQLEDLGSTNGTFVDGVRVHSRQKLEDGAVIRVGRAVLVFHERAAPLLEPAPVRRYGMAGRFYVGPLLEQLEEAATSVRNVLLVGPTGTGKELAARACASLMGQPKAPLRMCVHNAARFSSEEEATVTLFGVGSRVFSNVEARAGLITEAAGGILFLDEVHNLPERVQRSLLRVIENKEAARIGEARGKQTDVRFVFASNMPEPPYGLAHDLFARLRVVNLLPISHRPADVPEIFNSLLRRALEDRGLDSDEVFNSLSGDHYEALCLDGFVQDNVRGLVDVADRLVTGIASGKAPGAVVTKVFGERFGHGPVVQRFRHLGDSDGCASHYDKNKAAIIQAFQECRGNISATERLLRSRGIRASRRWLSVFLEKWGIRKA